MFKMNPMRGSGVKNIECSSRTQVQKSQKLHDRSQLSVVPVLRAPVPSYGLGGHQAHTCSTDLYAGKTPIHIK